MALWVNSIGEKIGAVMDDYRTNYPILRRNARKAVEQGFNWQEIATKSIEIYRQVLQGNNTGSEINR